jgi:hypothetical protein
MKIELGKSFYHKLNTETINPIIDKMNSQIKTSFYTKPYTEFNTMLYNQLVWRVDSIILDEIKKYI